jgi:hypothetical protein
MIFTFEIKTEPVTQATIMVAIVAFAFGSLALIAIYSQSPLVSAFCSVVLAVVVYSALCFVPR